MQDSHSLKRWNLLQPLHYHWQQQHSRSGHHNSRYHHLSDSFSSCQSTLSHHISILILNLNSVLQLVLPHQGNIDAIRSSDSSKGHVTLDERSRRLLPIWLATNGSDQGTGGRWDVGDHHLVHCRWGIRIAICVVDECVKWLIYPLPKDNSGCGAKKLRDVRVF